MGSVGVSKGAGGKSAPMVFTEFKNPPSHSFTAEQEKYFSQENVSNYKEWEASLGKFENSAIGKYTGSGFDQINAELFDIKNFDDMSSYTKQNAYQLQKALNKFDLHEPMVVWRGTTAEKLGIDLSNISSLEGTTKVFDGFLSSSAASQPAFDSKPVWLKISTPSGQGIGAWIGSKSEFKGETEWLFNSGAALKFGKPVYTHGHWEIPAEYVGKNSKIPLKGKKKGSK